MEVTKQSAIQGAYQKRLGEATKVAASATKSGRDVVDLKPSQAREFLMASRKSKQNEAFLAISKRVNEEALSLRKARVSQKQQLVGVLSDLKVVLESVPRATDAEVHGAQAEFRPQVDQLLNEVRRLGSGGVFNKTGRVLSLDMISEPIGVDQH
ncbi:MAG: hypothetical protein AB8B67_05085, partial [Rickettsiaceae bacterium]